MDLNVANTRQPARTFYIKTPHPQHNVFRVISTTIFCSMLAYLIALEYIILVVVVEHFSAVVNFMCPFYFFWPLCFGDTWYAVCFFFVRDNKRKCVLSLAGDEINCVQLLYVCTQCGLNVVSRDFHHLINLH